MLLYLGLGLLGTSAAAVALWWAWARSAEGQTEESAALWEVHCTRRRRVVGCMGCFQEIPPQLPKEAFEGAKKALSEGAMLCGTCREDYWLCKACCGGAEEHQHGHPLHPERVELEVGVKGIEEATQSGSAMTALRECFQAYQLRWMLGERASADSGEFEWKTYKEVEEECERIFWGVAESFSREIQADGDEASPGYGRFCILLGAPSSAWYLCYFSMLLHGIPLVPMQSNSTVEQIERVVQLTGARVVFASTHLPLPHLSSDVTVVRYDDGAHRYDHFGHSLPSCGSHDLTLAAVSARGVAMIEDGKCPTVEVEEGDNAVRLLLTSSGTTGMPKLIMVTDLMLRQSCTPPRFGVPLVMLSVQPLRQALDIIAKGGRIGSLTSIAELSHDLALVRPTMFGSTPSFFTALKHDFDTELSARIERIVGQQLEETEEKTALKLAKANLAAEWAARNILGNRCRSVIVGGAASSEELRTFIFSSLGASVINGYGSTETGAVSADGEVRDGVDLVLIDAPEFGYLTSDKPHPRGQIVVTTPRMSPGYFGDEEATKRQFISIGGVRYSRTGDIGRVVNGRIEVIDRIGSLFKLSSGTFVAPAELETLYLESSLVRQVLIWGSSSISRVVAAVVTADNATSEEAVLESIAAIGHEKGLAGSLVPSTVVVDSELWTVDNGLLNAAGKPVRPKLIAHYRDRLQQAAASVPCDDTDGNTAQPHSSSHTGEGLLPGLVAILHDSIPELGSGARLTIETTLLSLGADSLAFARIVTAARERFASRMTLPQLLKCHTIDDLQRVLLGGPIVREELPGGDVVAHWMGELDSAIATWRQCIKSDRFGFRAVPEVSQSDKPFTVLMTGATGFLGCFLLADLLQRGAWVLCVVRGTEKASHRQRILSVAEKYGLSDVLDENNVRWTAVQGNITEPDFGMEWPAVPVDLLLHCAASVGSSLPYSVIREHNVTGTIHAAAVAHSLGCRFLHISTVGFLGGLAAADKRHITPAHLSRLGSYAQSKWVADQFAIGLEQPPTSLVRVGTCFGASLSGAANENDSVIRLIAGLAREGVYALGNGSPLPRSFRLAPVDWVASEVIDQHVLPLMGPSSQPFIPRVTVAMTMHNTSLEEIIAAMQQSGVPMREVTAAEFRERMAAIRDDTHPLFVYASTLADSGFASDENTESEVRDTSCTAANLEAVILWMLRQPWASVLQLERR